MQKLLLILGACSGMMAVVAGAFGSHILKAALGPAEMEIYKTAVSYQFYHTFALFIGVFSFRFFVKMLFLYSAVLFTGGILLFSGSLYCLSLFNEQATITAIAGPITPIGGTLFIAGWFLLILGYLKTGHIKIQSKYE